MLRNRFPETSSKTDSSSGDGQGKYGKKKTKTSSSSMLSFVKYTVVLVVFLIFFFGIICPVVFRSSLFIRKGLLFMNWLNLPLFRNLSNPEMEFGLNCTRSFYIESEAGIRLGIWHILPKSRINECDLNNPERLPADKAFDDDRQIILYLHGNGGARGGNHRKELYKILAYNDKLDSHVIAVDYRGYGDSSSVDPTSSGLVSDASDAYDWVLHQVKGRKDRITIWGHSLGTAVATYLLAKTDPYGQPSSLILEAPFSSIYDAISYHPLSSVFRSHPLFTYFFVDPMVENDETNFDSAAKIRNIHCHLLILHALDDVIVPYPLGYKLYQAALESRPKTAPPAQLITFEAEKGYGHKGIFKDKDLPDILAEFISKARKWSRTNDGASGARNRDSEKMNNQPKEEKKRL